MLKFIHAPLKTFRSAVPLSRSVSLLFQGMHNFERTNCDIKPVVNLDSEDKNPTLF